MAVEAMVSETSSAVVRDGFAASRHGRRRYSRRDADINGYLILMVVGLCLLAGLAAGTDNGTLAIGLIVVLIGAVILIEWPLAGALVLVSVVPALSGLNRGLPVPGFRLSEVLIVGIATITLLTGKPGSWRKFDYLAIVYVTSTLAFGVLDLSGRGMGASGEYLGKLIGPLEFFLLYRTVRCLARRPCDRRTIIRWAMLASIPAALLGLLQFVNVPGTRALAAHLAGETETVASYHTLYRATALFAQGHLLDSYLMVTVLLGVAYLYDSRPPPLDRRVIIGIVALAGLGMGVTATITPILGAIAGIFALAYWYGRLGKALLTMSIVAALAVLVFSATVAARYNEQFNSVNTHHSQQYENSEVSSSIVPSTVLFRWDVWTRQYLPTIGRHLWTGYGPDLPPEVIWKATESAYITILLRGGIPLLLVFVGLMVIVARSAVRVRDDRRPLARATFVLTLALAVMQTQNNYLLDSGLPQLWWGLLGVLFAETTIEGRRAMRIRARGARGEVESYKPRGVPALQPGREPG